MAGQPLDDLRLPHGHAHLDNKANGVRTAPPISRLTRERLRRAERSTCRAHSYRSSHNGAPRCAFWRQIMTMRSVSILLASTFLSTSAIIVPAALSPAAAQVGFNINFGA